MPTLPGPTSQTPLLQAKSDVISDGLLVVAAVADAVAPRLARSSEGMRMAAARQNLDGMVCLPYMTNYALMVPGQAHDRLSAR
jgi:hypothetical protein